MHGKTSPVYHYGTDIFDGVPSPFDAMRYHSLLVHEPLPDCLEATAFTTEGESDGPAAPHRTRSSACSSTRRASSRNTGRRF